MTVALNAIHHGPAEGVPLLIAHGLFGSARNWGAVAKRLSATRPVTAVDMRNHGHSPWAENHSYQDLADDLAAALAGPSDVLGHSMGGKAAMVLALARPDLVRRLVVADIAPVGYGHTQAPLIHAMRDVDLSGVTRRSEADLAAPDDGTRAFLLQSLDVEGKRWRLNLDVLEREMDRIIGFPEVSGTFEGPVLFLTGGASDYVRPAHHDRIRALFPDARFETVEGAGHWLHAERPREFVAAVEGFLAG
ncbi:alpha/beta fold hydrolase [Jannaschia sp. Os4]|uniref:alpha/beta fold hydrolase n=1 Tax=Jannaschia sp. Os4 TaxID=2807617 RepID=UPI00193997DD|nr:alpha/beta fold hydrolase [Jannaschia sp. Os4]MBM2574745.1 alpha/beta fold hydrolase [Jannaschia sp. Os4]